MTVWIMFCVSCELYCLKRRFVTSDADQIVLPKLKLKNIPVYIFMLILNLPVIKDREKRNINI